MKLKNFIIAAILFYTPYTVSHLFVAVFLIPVLFLIYSRDKLPVFLLIAIFSVSSAVALLPVITYDIGAYFFGIFIVTSFLGIFLFTANFLIKRSSSQVLSVLTPPALWVSILYLADVRSLMRSAFDVGILFPMSAPVIWYLGSIGITLLLVMFNAGVAHFLAKRDRFSLALSIFLACLFVGSYAFSMIHAPEGTGKDLRKIALVQGDVAKRNLFGYTEDLDDRIGRYVALSKEAEAEGVSLVVWPEFSLPVDVMAKFPEKMAPIERLVASSGAEYVIGSMYTDPEDKDTRYNSAFIFDPSGRLEDIYYSEEPAIFNEGITPRDNGDMIFLDGAAVTLCWEEISERIFREYARNGAEYFLALSSNAALDYSWFKGYISYFSRARAAENMRYTARVTQSGITQLVSPMGKVISKIPSGRAEYLTGEVGYITARTFYTDHGDVIVRVFVLAIGLIVAIMGLSSLIADLRTRANGSYICGTRRSS